MGFPLGARGKWYEGNYELLKEFGTVQLPIGKGCSSFIELSAILISGHCAHLQAHLGLL